MKAKDLAEILLRNPEAVVVGVDVTSGIVGEVGLTVSHADESVTFGITEVKAGERLYNAYESVTSAAESDDGAVTALVDVFVIE